MLNVGKRPYLLRSKLCNEVIKAEIESGYKGRFSFFQREIRQGNISLNYGTNVFVSNYSIQFQGEGNRQHEKPSLGYILSVSACDDFGPSVPQKVVFFNEYLKDKQFTFDFDIMRKKYYTKYGSRGLISFDNPNALSIGKFFGIMGADQYYRWRDVLRQIIGQILRRRPRHYDLRVKPADVNTTLDFYVHLLMAVSLHPLSETK